MPTIPENKPVNIDRTKREQRKQWINHMKLTNKVGLSYEGMHALRKINKDRLSKASYK